MITKFRIGAAGVVLISAMGIATSANAATANATATAVILAPLELENLNSLDFGTIAVNGAGTATVGTGTVTCTGNLICTGGSPADFRVRGEAGRTVSLSYANVTTLSNGGGGTMALSNFTT
jgi:hypothetical protein